MMMELGAPIVRDGVRRSRRDAGRRDVVADVAVESLDLFLRCLALKVHEVRCARLFRSRATSGEIHQPLVAGYREGLSGGLRRHVLTEIAVAAFPLEQDRFRRQDPIASAERCRGIFDDLLFGGRVACSRRLRAPPPAHARASSW